MDRKPRIHVHILRTGGTTLRCSLEKYYKKHPVAVNHTARQLASISPTHYYLIQGHFCYGVHRLLEIPPRYITFLRHPVARVLSVVYSNNRNATEKDVWDSIESGALFGIVKPSVVQLAGIYDLDNWTNVVPTQELLETAKSNLDDFEFVGFTEYFKESMARLCFLTGWHIPKLVDANRSAIPVRMPDEHSNLYKAISEYYSHGIELYEWAKDRYLGDIL